MTTKQKAKPALELAYGARHIMSKYTTRAIARRHGQTTDMVSQMRKGRDPDHIPTKIKTKIRMDFMRYDDAAKDYRTLDQIALDLGVSRTKVRHWAKEFGLSRDMKKPERQPVKRRPVELLWPGTPMGRFAVMKLSSNPAQSMYY